MRLLTIGHSNLEFAGLLDRLRAHRVGSLADVRRFPRSQRHPQFDRAALEPALAAAGIAYRHWEALGGYREPRPGSPHLALAEPLLRGYADHMESAPFDAALRALLEEAGRGVTALMCAEADPRHCHRWLLSDALVLRGVEVEHVTGAGARARHVRSATLMRAGERWIYADPAPRLPGL